MPALLDPRRAGPLSDCGRRREGPISSKREVADAVEENEERVRASSPFGMLLRRYRLAAKLSQGALAERARMSSNGISALERGDRQTPQRETLALLTQALRLDDEQRRAFQVAAARPAGLRPGDGRVSVLPERGGDDAPVVPNTNLSPSLTSFVGRETELGEIIALVREHRLVTLTGGGGVGKTRIALEIGARLLDGSDDGVWLVNLAPLHDASLVAATIARALEVEESPGQPVLETLVAYLKAKTLLLIVDNCEHLLAQAAAVVSASCVAARNCVSLPPAVSRSATRRVQLPPPFTERSVTRC